MSAEFMIMRFVAGLSVPRRSTRQIAVLLATFLTWIGSSLAAEYHVTPTGSDTAPGTPSEPLSLSRAISSKGPARPGDTIWLHGGRYEGPFTSSLTGSKDQPILISTTPGERVILEGTTPNTTVLTINGTATWFRGFEVMNSSTNRTDTRGTGVEVLGPHTKLIDLIVHDTGVGIGCWTPALNAEISGCIIFNNGHQGPAPDRGHGHAIYAQNESGTKVFRDNIMFNQFGWGVHIYTEGGAIKGFDLEGNISFNNGTISRDTNHYDNFLIGGYKPAERIRFVNNFGYHTPEKGGMNVRMGYSKIKANGTNNFGNADIFAASNYIAGGTWAVQWWTNVTFLDNTFIGDSVSIPTWGPGDFNPAEPYVWDRNHLAFRSASGLTGYRTWTGGRGYDVNGTSSTNLPTQTRVFVRRTAHDTNRVHVIVYNWALQSQVDVDLTGALPPESAFEVRNAQDYFGPTVHAGIYDGQPITLPMTNLTVEKAVGVESHPGPTWPEFAVFIVNRVEKPEPPTNLRPVSD